jgi:phosphoglycerate dehydrogenase-like enzyme
MICIVVGDMTSAGLDRLRVSEPEVRFVCTEDASPAALGGAEVLFVWDFRSRELDQILPRLPNLRWIHTASAGVDHVLSPSVVERGLTVSNSSGVFERPIAEYVLAIILAHAKGLLATAAAQSERRWAYRETPPMEGAEMVVVGAGKIGRAVAAAASSIGVRVTGVRQVAGPAEPGLVAVVAVSSLPTVLRTADYVVVTVAATERTRNLVDREVLGYLKPTAYLVNVSRGSVLDTEALVDALRGDRLAGAALDVFDDEPLQDDSPLWSVPNLFVSPHMSGDTVGWDERVVDLFLENLRWYRSGEQPANQIDLARGY